MNDVWININSLEFNSIVVNSNTEWTHLKISDNSNIFGEGEISHTQLSRNVSPIVAKLANNLRGKKVYTDYDVITENNLSVEGIESDQLLATAVSGLRCAITDALSKQSKLKMYEYILYKFGEKNISSNRVQLYANINRSLLLDKKTKQNFNPVLQEVLDRSPESFSKMAKFVKDQGFKTLKCAPFDECKSPFSTPGLPKEAKIGLSRISSVIESIGDSTLLVDCHSRFDNESAYDLLYELTDRGVGWYEEPIDPIEYPSDIRRIKGQSTIPIAGAEHGYGLQLFEKFIDDDTLDIVMPDIKFCGGPIEAFLIGKTLESKKEKSVSMHCPSGPLSLLASAHSTLAFNNTLPLEHAVYEIDWRKEVLFPNENIIGDMFVIPDGYGLGAQVDPLIVHKHGDFWTE